MHYVSAESFLFYFDNFSSVLTVLRFIFFIIFLSNCVLLMMQYVVYTWKPKSSLPRVEGQV